MNKVLGIHDILYRDVDVERLGMLIRTLIWKEVMYFKHGGAKDPGDYYYVCGSRWSSSRCPEEKRCLAECDDVYRIAWEREYNVESKKFYDALPREKSEVKEKDKSVTKFYGACPEVECRGFLNSKFKCGICGSKVCSKCHARLDVVEKESDVAAKELRFFGKEEDEEDEESGKEHVCNESDLATVEFVKKTCKNCPSCKTQIYKIHGCSQMWCTFCGCAFSWSTGKKISTRYFHNPHQGQILTKNGIEKFKKNARRNDGGYNSVFYREYYNRYNYLEGYHVAYKCIEFLDYATRKTDIRFHKEQTVLGISFVSGDLSLEKYKKRCQEVDKAHRKFLKQKEAKMELAKTLLDAVTSPTTQHDFVWNEVSIANMNDLLKSIFDRSVEKLKNIDQEFQSVRKAKCYQNYDNVLKSTFQ
jgi:hypothetical protein